MKLKELFLYIIFILLFSCDSKDNSPVNLFGEGGEYCIESSACEIVLTEFTANDTWYSYIKYKEGSGWIDLSETDGSSGRFAIKASVKANESNNSRNVTIVVKSGKYKIEYHILQEGKQGYPDKPEDPIEPEKPIEPDTITSGETPSVCRYAFVSGISVSSYNDLFQLKGKKSYKFTYSEGKIVSIIEESEGGKKSVVNVEYFKDKLVISDDIFKESVIGNGYLQEIESAPVNYENSGIRVGDWMIGFTEYGVESVSRSENKVSLTYSGNANYINNCNVDIAALICVSLIRDMSTPDFVYSQKALYNIRISNHSYFQKANIGDHLYLYDYLLNNGKVVRIDEYYQPKYVQNWLKRRIEISYL